MTRLRLYCFSYAGGTAMTYRRWPALMPPDVDVYPVELPGRGARSAEPLCTEMDVLMSSIARRLAGALVAPYAVFGHSMGALVAFEFARWATRALGSDPLVLYVSGRRAPHLPQPQGALSTRSSPQLFEMLRRLNGQAMGFVRNERLRGMIEPILRADCAVADTYRPYSQAQVGCPIVAFGGIEDPWCGEGELQPWQLYSSGPFASHMLPGGHFFLESHRDLLIARLTADLTSRLGVAPAGVA